MEWLSAAKAKKNLAFLVRVNRMLSIPGNEQPRAFRKQKDFSTSIHVSRPRKTEADFGRGVWVRGSDSSASTQATLQVSYLSLFNQRKAASRTEPAAFSPRSRASSSVVYRFRCTGFWFIGFLIVCKLAACKHPLPQPVSACARHSQRANVDFDFRSARLLEERHDSTPQRLVSHRARWSSSAAKLQGERRMPFQPF
ncbi:hypothetical protein [Paracoccus sp. (in: a-proteobacteria)]|uniref:hypothetical protein n=1 Tax=Paracoccus sp. TaxID=267 RepID=UPI00396CD2E4